MTGVSLFAIKRETKQAWTASGLRIPVTVLRAKDNVFFSKTDTEQYLAFGTKDIKRMTKPEAGNLKKAGLLSGIRMIRKVFGDFGEQQVGGAIAPSSVFIPGDVVKVTGTSKGMGFAGVMKRHGFKGGPKTHGQSDRERAPGASSSGTQLGHVWKGKKFPGRGGNKTVSVENLQVVVVDDATGEIWVKGVVPGAINGTVQITKVNTGKFEGMFKKTDKVEKAKEVKEVKEVNAETKPVEAEPVKVEEKPAQIEKKVEEKKEVKAE